MNDHVQTQSQKPIELDAPIYDDIESASEALLARWEDAEKPSEQETDVATEPADIEETEQLDQEAEADDTDLETDEDGEDPEETDETEEIEEEDSEEDEVEQIDDDAIVEITIDGEVKQASVAELKRLYGQEASLTRKSQETAQKRKEAEEQLTKTSAILNRMLEQAEARYKPYSEVDMLVAAKQMTTDDFAQLRKEAQTAADDVKFLKEESDKFYRQLQEDRQQAMQAAAKEAIKVLQTDIPEWSNSLYDDIRSYAVSQGLPEEEVNQYVDPNVIKLINKARLYDQAKKITTTKKKRTAKKVLRATKTPNGEANMRAKKLADAQAKLRNSNDLDDIANVLLSRWEV